MNRQIQIPIVVCLNCSSVLTPQEAGITGSCKHRQKSFVKCPTCNSVVSEYGKRDKTRAEGRMISAEVLIEGYRNLQRETDARQERIVLLEKILCEALQSISVECGTAGCHAYVEGLALEAGLGADWYHEEVSAR